MYSFMNDYSEGAAPAIMNKLLETNMCQTVGYGMDEYCKMAKEAILRHLKHDSIIHFLVGGTQTNLTVIASVLRPFEGAVAAESGHIGCHETGAVEATGHKVLPIPHKDGKITAEAVDAYIEANLSSPTAEHTVKPGMVYISNPTEYGTIYKKAELEALHSVCKKHGIPLYVDGARLACALMSPENDVSISDMCDLTDIFYIGGTKMGAMFGEAVVFNDKKYAEDFRYMIKRQGGMFAKGRLLGIQFLELFRDNLYFELGSHAVSCAQHMQTELKAMGYKFLMPSVTNQIFPILSKKQIEEISKDFILEFWEKYDDGHDVYRICTSWATVDSQCEALLKKAKELI